MKVLVCGSRYWVDQKAIERELGKLPPSILVHGAARGADNIAGYVAKQMGWEVRAYPADWNGFENRKAAGPARNRQMLREEHPDKDGVFIDLAFAFHEDPGLGVGTKDMHSLLVKAKPLIRVKVLHR